jgi:NAD-dependent SIR2 family protein deacetylase
MARQMTLRLTADTSKLAWNPSRVLAEAMAEKALFLNKNPQYRSYQREIDRLLEKAGHSENRMTVLAMLMEAKLVELHTQLKKLNAILVRFDTAGGQSTGPMLS